MIIVRYLSKYISGINQTDAGVLSIQMANINARRAHKTMSWAELARTCLLHEPEMSSENFTSYLRNRIAEYSGEIITAGNTIVMDLPHKPVRIRMNRFMMDMIFENIIERAVRKSVPYITFYVNLWVRENQAFLLIGDNRKEPANSWKLTLMRKIIEYHNGQLLVLGQNKNMQKKDAALEDNACVPENGLYFVLRLPIVE